MNENAEKKQLSIFDGKRALREQLDKYRCPGCGFTHYPTERVCEICDYDFQSEELK